MSQIEIGDYYYFSVPKGTVIEIPHPLWNEDTKENMVTVRARLESDVVVCTTSEMSVLTVLEVKE